ncbi:MAG TPA: DUF362 domain-containing protein [Thermoanaerobaculaceae bacterium]|nr:DUF362 domain-containing protein [Thermoanaerobaculaceae bacterium]
MSGDRTGITRRGVLAGIAGGAVAATLGRHPVLAADEKARVVRVESDKVWKGDARDPRVVKAMIDRAVVALAGAATVEAAWRRFVPAGARVGLKINLLGRPLAYTAPEVTDAVAAGVIAAGAKPADVLVWDRWRDHFAPTRYRFGQGAHGESIESGGRYHPTVRLKGSQGEAPIDTIATDRTDVTVSLPVLKDHGVSGVTLALKNITFGCYDHYRTAHDNNCDPFIAEAYEHFLATTRVPLIVMDATEACFDGGPRPADRSRLWRENAIYVATDPVALDVVCRRAISAKRAQKGLPDLTRQSRHIETAARKRLGEGRLERIEVVTLKV